MQIGCVRLSERVVRMSEFEYILACLLIPITYVFIYIAGKYDMMLLICKMLEEKLKEYKEKDGAE